MLTRTYGGVASPSFPTVALLASVAAYADAAGTGALRRVSCDDGFQIAYRRSRGGVLWVLASGNGEDDATVDATLLMCERIAEGICGREALDCHAAARERGGAQRMKLALGASSRGRQGDGRAGAAPFAPSGSDATAPRRPSKDERSLRERLSRGSAERVASVAASATARLSRDPGGVSRRRLAGLERDERSRRPRRRRRADVHAAGAVRGDRRCTSTADGRARLWRRRRKGPDGSVTPVVTGPSPTLEVFRAVVKLTNSKLSYH